jgi:hypothetical protein
MEIESQGKQQLTSKLIERWSANFEVTFGCKFNRHFKKFSKNKQKDKPFETIRETVSALKAVLKNVVTNKSKQDQQSNYHVEGSDCKLNRLVACLIRFTGIFWFQVFNTIIRVCMKDMVPNIYRILDLKVNETDEIRKKCKLPNEGSYWKVLKVPIKSYLDDMLNASYF